MIWLPVTACSVKLGVAEFNRLPLVHAHTTASPPAPCSSERAAPAGGYNWAWHMHKKIQQKKTTECRCLLGAVWGLSTPVCLPGHVTPPKIIKAVWGAGVLKMHCFHPTFAEMCTTASLCLDFCWRDTCPAICPALRGAAPPLVPGTHEPPMPSFCIH